VAVPVAILLFEGVPVALDIQVIFPSDIIPLTSVRVIPGLVPRSLDVLGSDFRDLDEVRINDVRSPSFVVLSRTRLLAQIPPSILNDSVTSVSVISNRLTLVNKSLIRFKLGTRTTKVSGMLRLMQVFLKILFTSKNRDIWSPRLGGNGLSALGSNFSRQEGQGIVADFMISVKDTSKQIVALQGRDNTIPRDERLLSANVQNISFNENESALIAGVELLNQTGERALSQLML